MWDAKGRPEGWIAGPIPLALVDVESDDDHDVELLSGDKAGWTATARSYISHGNFQEVLLNGNEPFTPTDEDANEAVARVVREATEGK